VAVVEKGRDGRFFIRPNTGSDLSALACSAVIRALADGTFVIEPLDQTVTVAEAAKILGVSASTVERLCSSYQHEDGSPVLEHSRVSAQRLMISRASLLRHLEGCRSDPEYWSLIRRVTPSQAKTQATSGKATTPDACSLKATKRASTKAARK